MAKKYDDKTLHKLQSLEFMILSDFADVCDKHGINYWIDYGTVIGAVRHGGFIPWDDDIDVGMPKEDYYKFLSVFDEEMSDKYEIYGYGTGRGFYNYIPKIYLKGTQFGFERAENGHKTGIFIDIFVWCNTADEPDTAKKHFKEHRKKADINYLLKMNFDRSDKKVSGGASAVTAIKYKGLIAVQKMLNAVPNIEKIVDKGFRKHITKYENKSNTYFAAGAFFYHPVKEENIFPLTTLNFCGKEFKAMKNYDGEMRFLYGDYMKLPPEEKRYNHAPTYLDFGPYGD